MYDRNLQYRAGFQYILSAIILTTLRGVFSCCVWQIICCLEDNLASESDGEPVKDLNQLLSISGESYKEECKSRPHQPHGVKEFQAKCFIL
jgi:hypothetical protein